MHEPTKQFIFSEKQVRFGAMAFTVGGIGLILLILFLATARPQGNFQALDVTEFEQHVVTATQGFSDYEIKEDGRAQLPISRAIELVVERGTANPGFQMP